MTAIADDKDLQLHRSNVITCRTSRRQFLQHMCRYTRI